MQQIPEEFRTTCQSCRSPIWLAKEFRALREGISENSCGFVERFHNCIVSIEKELKDQTVLAFNSVRNSVPPDNSRVLDEVKFDVLIHDLDLFNFLNKDVILENIKVVQNNEFANAIYADNKVVGNFSAKATIKPSIAAQPLYFSAFSVITVFKFCMNGIL